MFRNTIWRRQVSDTVSWHQDQALGTTIYILREFGPTGFLLKEEGETKNFKVLLGDPHSCSCSAFIKEKELCKHICWILLKKFRLPRDHEYAFQLGLVEREINELLRGLHQIKTPRPQASTPSVKVTTSDGGSKKKQKEIDTDDICPICQEELLKKRLPVTYCRNGCGNNVHISCMKIWADHQALSDNDVMVKCPLCREDFGPLKLILEEYKNSTKLITTAEKEQLDKHLGIPCNNCHVFPIHGKCYRCTECRDYHLCEECFTSCCHSQHNFTFRLKRNQGWLSAEQVKDLPLTHTINLWSDLTNEGYTSDEFLKDIDTMCSSSLPGVSQEQNVVPKHIVKALPFMIVRQGSKLLLPGYQCRMCLSIFNISQSVRYLPCNHKFHKECIDPWLLQECNSCPLDGQMVYNPLTWKDGLKGEKAKSATCKQNHLKLPEHMQAELYIPGIGLSFGKSNVKGSQTKQLLHNQEPKCSQMYANNQDGLELSGFKCFLLTESTTQECVGDKTENPHFNAFHQNLPPNVLRNKFNQKQNCPVNLGKKANSSIRMVLPSGIQVSTLSKGNVTVDSTYEVHNVSEQFSSGKIKEHARSAEAASVGSLFLGRAAEQCDSALRGGSGDIRINKMQKRYLPRRPKYNPRSLVPAASTFLMEGTILKPML
ncbi:E3 ubiquitin-protein ligase ZSWIM2 [Protopterus annectens]|uniref:E3 ubiquitin-protein ligase ZSWIM2 n=1 Tax=Protopterus annectens TaxID=7888 RepID=UPI001CFC2333|nr:E3 ubiquitin-protein ligase ZSWIM2 [Protopterus annectens]